MIWNEFEKKKAWKMEFLLKNFPNLSLLSSLRWFWISNYLRNFSILQNMKNLREQKHSIALRTRGIFLPIQMSLWIIYMHMLVQEMERESEQDISWSRNPSKSCLIFNEISLHKFFIAASLSHSLMHREDGKLIRVFVFS